jgi:hypothetical protein
VPRGLAVSVGGSNYILTDEDVVELVELLRSTCKPEAIEPELAAISAAVQLEVGLTSEASRVQQIELTDEEGRAIVSALDRATRHPGRMPAAMRRLHNALASRYRGQSS